MYLNIVGAHKSESRYLNPFKKIDQNFIYAKVQQGCQDATTLKGIAKSAAVVAGVAGAGAILGALGGTVVLSTIVFGSVALLNEGTKLGLNHLAQKRHLSMSTLKLLSVASDCVAIAACVGLTVAASLIAPPLGAALAVALIAIPVLYYVPYAVALLRFENSPS